MCMTKGTLRSKLGPERFYVVSESLARAMAAKITDIMFAGRDVFNRFPTMRPAGGFAPDPIRGMELINEKHSIE